MQLRTDLANELNELNPDITGVYQQNIKKDGYRETVTRIVTNSAAEKLGRPIGKYIYFESDERFDAGICDSMGIAIQKALTDLLPDRHRVLVCGLGNVFVTPDAVGPKTVEGIIVTGHLDKTTKKITGLENLNTVYAVCPGVSGQTGMEAAEIIKSVVNDVKPTAVLAIDALAARRMHRLGRTIQLCDSGISPGSGVGNSRGEISEKTVGVKVISIGIPTVSDVSTVITDSNGEPESTEENMIVTLPDIDFVVKKGAQGLAFAINSVLQPGLDKETLSALS